MNKTQALGHRRNVLLRYRAVMVEFDKYDCMLIPIAVIHRTFIYPKFHISKDTLYRIFNTDIERELEELKEIYLKIENLKNQQSKMF